MSIISDCIVQTSVLDATALAGALDRIFSQSGIPKTADMRMRVMRTRGQVGVQCVEGRVVVFGDVLGSIASGTGNWDESVNRVLNEAKAGAESVLMVVEIAEERVVDPSRLLEPPAAAASRTPTVTTRRTLSRAPTVAVLEAADEEHVMSGANAEAGQQSRTGMPTPVPPVAPLGSVTGNMPVQADVSHAGTPSPLESGAATVSGRGSHARTVVAGVDEVPTEGGEAQESVGAPDSVAIAPASHDVSIRDLTDIGVGEEAGVQPREQVVPVSGSVRSANRRSVRSTVPA